MEGEKIKTKVNIDELDNAAKLHRVSEEEIKSFQEKAHEQLIIEQGKQEEQKDEPEIESIPEDKEYRRSLKDVFSNPKFKRLLDRRVNMIPEQTKRPEMTSVGGFMLPKETMDMLFYGAIGLIGAYGMVKLFSIYGASAAAAPIEATVTDVAQLLNK